LERYEVGMPCGAVAPSSTTRDDIACASWRPTNDTPPSNIASCVASIFRVRAFRCDHFERARFKALVIKPIAAPVEMQDIDSIAAPVDKQVQAAEAPIWTSASEKQILTRSSKGTRICCRLLSEFRRSPKRASSVQYPTLCLRDIQQPTRPDDNGIIVSDSSVAAEAIYRTQRWCTCRSMHRGYRLWER